MKNNSIRTVVATGIGAALFIIIGMFVNIPTFWEYQHPTSVCCSSPILSEFLGLLQVSLWALLGMRLKMVFNTETSHGLGCLQVPLQVL